MAFVRSGRVPWATGLFVEIAQLIKKTDFSIRRTPAHASPTNAT